MKFITNVPSVLLVEISETIAAVVQTEKGVALAALPSGLLLLVMDHRAVLAPASLHFAGFGIRGLHWPMVADVGEAALARGRECALVACRWTGGWWCCRC